MSFVTPPRRTGTLLLPHNPADHILKPTNGNPSFDTAEYDGETKEAGVSIPTMLNWSRRAPIAFCRLDKIRLKVHLSMLVGVPMAVLMAFAINRFSQNL